MILILMIIFIFRAKIPAKVSKGFTGRDLTNSEPSQEGR